MRGRSTNSGRPMTSNREEQADRLRTLLQDIRKPKDTLHGRTQIDDRGGRFAAMGKPVITGSTPGPQYPRLPSGPWSEGLDQVSSPEPLIDATDCSDTYIGEPLGSPAEAMSEPALPIDALALGHDPHVLQAPPSERPLAPGGGASKQPKFVRRV